MANEIKVGDYIRTRKGSIGQVTNIAEWGNRKKYLIHWDIGKTYYITGLTIIDNDSKISKLIKVGDYVNGQKITKITKDPFIKEQIDLWTDRTIPFDGDYQQERFIENEIETVVTKEQFEIGSYKVRWLN